MRAQNSYHTYLNYKKILKALKEGETTISELSKKTRISTSTIRRMTEALLAENILEVTSFQEFKNDKVQRVRKFKIKKGRL